MHTASHSLAVREHGAMPNGFYGPRAVQTGREITPPSLVGLAAFYDLIRHPDLKIQAITVRHSSVKPPIAIKLKRTGTSAAPKNDQRKPEIK